MFFFRNYKTIIFIVVLLVAALVFLSYNLRQKSSGGLVTRAILEVAAPVQSALSTSVKNVSEAWYHYLFLVGIEEENKNLKKKIDDLKSQLILYQEGFLEAQRLRNLLSLKDSHNFNFVPAQVVGREHVALSKTFLINKGTVHGLNTGMAVMAAPGLVGRVIEASWHVSKVLPIIDENSNIDVIVQRTRLQGIIRGAGSRGCIMKYISKTQDIREGDIVISSGIGGIFPKGIIIGQVSHVDKQEAGLFLRINVTPSVDFSKLEEVSVVTASHEKDENE
ncbi:MAG: rod shape-determining protein MreC [Smithella sp.]